MRRDLCLAWNVLIVLVAVAIAGSVSTAHAAESCGSPSARPTVQQSGDESGIGGTGLQNATPDRTKAFGDDSESGIGGTGIFGTVTHIDRLCVNGLEIIVPEKLLAQSAEESRSGALAVGMVVWIRATQTADGLVAERLEIRPGLAGRVESVGPDGRSLVIADEVVDLPSAAYRASELKESPLRVGQGITVHGLRDQDQRWVASRIDVAHGPDLDRDPKEASNVRDLDRSPAPWLADGSGLQALSIEGFVSGSEERPRLAGLDLVLEPTMSPRQSDTIRPGIRMTATGRVGRDGVLHVERATTVDRPRRGPSIDRKTPPSPTSPPESSKPTKPALPSDANPSRTRGDSRERPVERRGETPGRKSGLERPRNDRIERGRPGRVDKPEIPRPGIDRPTTRPRVDRPSIEGRNERRDDDPNRKRAPDGIHPTPFIRTASAAPRPVRVGEYAANLAR